MLQLRCQISFGNSLVSTMLLWNHELDKEEMFIQRNKNVPYLWQIDQINHWPLNWWWYNTKSFFDEGQRFRRLHLNSSHNKSISVNNFKFETFFLEFWCDWLKKVLENFVWHHCLETICSVSCQWPQKGQKSANL